MLRSSVSQRLKVKQCTQDHWLTTVTSEQLQLYIGKGDKLSLEDGCLLWGTGMQWGGHTSSSS